MDDKQNKIKTIVVVDKTNWRLVYVDGKFLASLLNIYGTYYNPQKRLETLFL